MSSTTGMLDVAGGRVWYKRVGEGGVPLLVLHGGPGFCHDYLEALEDLADEREVVFFDQLGCGHSERPNDPGLWTVDFYVEEVAAVREGLGLDRCHLFGNSWGGMLAMAYVLDRRPRLVSLTVSNSPASVPRFVADSQELKRQLPGDVKKTIDWHEQNHFFDCPEYTAATALWYRKHICRMEPWPAGLERSFAGIGMDPYVAMVGHSEFHVTGNLKYWDVTDRLREIEVPTLFISGEHDEIRPPHVRDMHLALPGSKLIHYQKSAHLPFEEERERFMSDYREFLALTESG
jgi:proline-specific peptidase